jgi:integrase/recombinase XerD
MAARARLAGRGPAALAAELVGRERAELPVVGELGEREQVIAAVALTGLRSARPRRAYVGDVAAWLGWLVGPDTEALAAGRVHVDLWATTQLDDGAAASSVRRHLSALSSFYRYCAAHDLIGRVPAQGVARPVVARTTRPRWAWTGTRRMPLVAAADADTGAQTNRVSRALLAERGNANCLAAAGDPPAPRPAFMSGPDGLARC